MLLQTPPEVRTTSDPSSLNKNNLMMYRKGSTRTNYTVTGKSRGYLNHWKLHQKQAARIEITSRKTEATQIRIKNKGKREPPTTISVAIRQLVMQKNYVCIEALHILRGLPTLLSFPVRWMERTSKSAWTAQQVAIFPTGSWLSQLLFILILLAIFIDFQLKSF